MPKDLISGNANSRRNFLRAGLVTTVASAAYPALGAARVMNQQSPDVIAREFELDELTIDDLQQAMQSGKYSSRGLTEKYLARIQDIDKGGPRINSVIEVNPEALEIAEDRSGHGRIAWAPPITPETGPRSRRRAASG